MTADRINASRQTQRSRLRRGIVWAIPLLMCLAIALAIVRSWFGRASASIEPAAAPATVAVTPVRRQMLYREISVPAEFRPYAEVDLHAKVAGYVEQMNVDIGDKVKTGQLLAVLEIPELQDELNHAIATRKREEADYRDAHLAYTRLLAVNKEHPNLIAQQDLDTAEAKDATAEGALAAAKADVGKYETLFGYTRITAPFAGVITKRYADPGTLIQAGTASDTQAMPLVRLSDNQRLRLDFPVSVDYVPAIRNGVAVTVRVDSLGGKTFKGQIARFADKVDDSTRTMIAEMDVDNRSLEYVPGMYATAVFKTEEHAQALAIPVEAVAPGGKNVMVVDAAHHLEERPIKLGLETPNEYEILSGLKEGDLVVVGSLGQLRAGQSVEPHITAPSSQP